MRIRSVLIAKAAALAAVSFAGAAHTADPVDAPYAGLERRAIAALSPSDVAALEAGRGWGFALPAELNGWPGPLHVLEAAEALALSDAQRAAVQAIFDRMSADARRLGEAFIAAEAALDAAFAEGAPDAAEIARLSGEAGAARGALRAVHLTAHLETTPLLTRHQRMTYAALRGYADGEGHSGHGHGRH